MPSLLSRATRRPASDLSFSVFLVTVCCAYFAHATSPASTSARRERPSPSARPTSRCWRRPCSLRSATDRRTMPSPWLLAATAAFALPDRASAIANGATRDRSGKARRVRSLTLGAAAFLETRSATCCARRVDRRLRVVAAFWGAVGFVAGAGGRQGSFLGEHDLAASGRWPSLRARADHPDRRPGLVAIVALWRAASASSSALSGEPPRPLSRERRGGRTRDSSVIDFAPTVWPRSLASP